MVLGLVTLGMVPRALGPTHYGNFSFLTFFFARLIKFLKMGTSSAYYTKISNRPEEQKLIGFYIYFIIWLSLMIAVGLAGIFLLDLKDVVWPEQDTIFIAAAALFAVLSLISNFIHATNDAYGFTVKSEFIFILQSFLGTTLILVFYLTGRLNLSTYFIIHYCLLGFVILAGWRILRSHQVNLFGNWALAWAEIKDYIKEFYKYSHPLFFNALVMFVVGVGDRWLLQNFGGSVEQGFYSLALKLGSICFLFTSSMAPLLTREMSISHRSDDRERMKRLFSKFIPMFYFIAAYFAIFIFFNADVVAEIIGGSKYNDATLAIAVLAFYPVHQTYGQLCGSVLLATERTRLIRNIGVSSGIMGVFLSFFLIAPNHLLGFNMGAVGLSIKMISIQFIAVNIQLWFNSKYLRVSFIKYFVHQIIVLLFLAILAFTARYFSEILSINIIVDFLINGIVYTLATAIILFLYPRLIAMTRLELIDYLATILRKLTVNRAGK